MTLLDVGWVSNVGELDGDIAGAAGAAEAAEATEAAGAAEKTEAVV